MDYPFVKSLGQVLVFNLISLSLQAQTITGKVQDSKTLEALPFANVFINNTTLGTVTDLTGDFSLSLPANKENSSYEIVFSFIGYETYKTEVTIDEGILNLGIVKLVSSETLLNTVEVSSSRDKEWGRNYRKFKKVFLGDDKFADACTILNPWVIDFSKDRTTGKFLAKADKPIEIENKALGYTVFFYLTDFWFNPVGYSIVGNARFSELKTTLDSELTSWNENRAKSYKNSTHYLFKSMIEKKINGAGFSLYRDLENVQNTITRSSMFYSEFGKTVFAYDTSSMVTPDAQLGFYKINLTGRVEVHDRKQKASKRVYDDVFGMVSWITLKDDFVVVNNKGFPINPTDVIVSGDMSKGRVAAMLPLDFTPQQEVNRIDEAVDKIDYQIYQEQIYVHTDKPYYYPGEAIWFKGYINYATPAFRDSLSRTVYVEIIDRKLEKVLLSKTLEIVDGVFNNDFQLPDTLTATMYYFRAYTNFNRNFNEKNLYTRPIPVLNITEKINSNRLSNDHPKSELLTISTDKKKYKTREKVVLSFRTDDENENPIAGNLSISVVDSAQVAHVSLADDILKGYLIKEIHDDEIDKHFPYAVEYGINFSGRFLNENGNPEKANLAALQLKSQQFTMTQSDEEGFFTIGGLSFYDTVSFLIQGIKGKGQTYGKSELIPRKEADIKFEEKSMKVEFVKTEFPQRVISDYGDLSDVRVLEAVEIKAKKVEEQYQLEYRLKRPYGKPDYVLKGDEINTSYGNLLQTLPGKIPGLIVREVINDGEGSRWVVYLQRQLSINNPSEVLITINNAIVGGSPGEILGAIDPNTVESVELKKGVNVLYGSVGGNGILAIYTKDISNRQEMNIRKDVAALKVAGYAKSRMFTSPDYDRKDTNRTFSDYRSTIYWNPEVVTDAKTGTATISFFAADLPGRYRIVVEGINKNSEPLRQVSYIDIINH